MHLAYLSDVITAAGDVQMTQATPGDTGAQWTQGAEAFLGTVNNLTTDVTDIFTHAKETAATTAANVKIAQAAAESQAATAAAISSAFKWIAIAGILGVIAYSALKKPGTEKPRKTTTTTVTTE